MGRQSVIDALEWFNRVNTAWDSFKRCIATLAPAMTLAILAWWKGATFFERVIVLEATWAAVLATVTAGLLLLDRFGSTADVRFVLEPGTEPRLYVKNRGPEAVFFASLWFQGEGIGPHQSLYGHWGDATEHRITLARNQTGMVILGRQAQEAHDIRRWELFATTHYNTLERLRPLATYRVGGPTRDDAHASVTVQILSIPALERPVPDVQIVFTDTGARRVTP